MRLLFDQNLSPRLPRLLHDIFPDSIHVREVALHESGDSLVWDYAKENGYLIVSKDTDFQQRSLLLGAPPKFIWLRLGNCSVAKARRCCGGTQSRFTLSMRTKPSRISCSHKFSSP
ncbi:hypothetical protein LBMAG57_35470 [Verrucomicrobiota bacterium]|nr:hypothetical protein LBMAG57_35470 [Verrucomicrobiota bacterium]